MNATELARQLKITTDELFDKLPQLGFDIGRRAIKIDDRIASKIIDVWKSNIKDEREKDRIAEIRGETAPTEEAAPAETKEALIPATITVRDFAAVLNLPVNKVLTELLKNGVLTSMNERIDFDTASIVGEELGYKINLDEAKVEDSSATEAQQKLKDILNTETGNWEVRPPVVVVMGHVDHGKTKILDAIRKADVVSQESGGITQHIGAYQVRKNGRLITFIDTPGHEAFTAMRSRGARIADIAILVIAADDGIQPQTKEAIKIIQDANLSFIVAINKIDKPEANIEKIKQALAQINLAPEDWGGKTICVPVSAKAGTGIDDLLETVLLVADMEKENIMADSARLAIGTIIESHIDKGEGPVATILIQAGMLKVGDNLCSQELLCGKVRSLKDYIGQPVNEAGPGMPVKILGLKISPEVGSVLEVVTDLKNLSKDVRQHRMRQEHRITAVSAGAENEDVAAINLIIKADVLGSAEAIIESLAKLETPEIKIKIVSRGLGNISESDVARAEATGAKILAFHVKPTPAVSDLAREKSVEIKYYEVIYHLLEDIEAEMELLKKKDVVRKLIGKLEVLKVFRKEGHNMILGGRVVDGAITASEIVIVIRNNEAIGSGAVIRLESAKQPVEKVASGQECGVGFTGKISVEVGDVLEFYIEEK